MTYFATTLIIWIVIFTSRNAQGPSYSLPPVCTSRALAKCDPVQRWEIVKTFNANGVVVRDTNNGRKHSLFLSKGQSVTQATAELERDLNQARLNGLAKNSLQDLENAIKTRALQVLDQCDDIRDRMRVIQIATSQDPVTAGSEYMNEATESEFGFMAPLIAAAQQRRNA